MLLLTKKDKTLIRSNLDAAQALTTAPIYIHFAHACRKDAMHTAKKFFRHAALDRSPDSNAVLLFIAKSSQAFVILGDRAAHEKLSDRFWNDCQKQLSDYFKQDKFVEGIDRVIREIAAALAVAYPAD